MKGDNFDTLNKSCGSVRRMKPILFLLLLCIYGTTSSLAFTYPARLALTRCCCTSRDKPAALGFGDHPYPIRTPTVRLATNSNDEDGNKDQSNWLLGLCLPLWLAYVSNQWSRSSIYYLVDFSDKGNAFTAMNIDLAFSQAQYGVLASVAFTSLFAIASLLAGATSDRYNRKILTVASITMWGLATLGTSLSTSYEQVVGWRVLMGLSCAFSTPTAYTLLAQRVPSDKVASATSLYSTGVALGGALASLSIVLDSRIGWRDTALAIALFAFGCAAINALVLDDDPKEPTKPANVDSMTSPETPDTSAVQEVQQVLSSNRIQLLFLASFLRFCSGLLIGVWSAPYFRLAFPENAGDYAVAQAFITATCGIMSSVIGGAIADRIRGNDLDDENIGRQLWIPVVGNLLATPAWYMAITSENSFQMAMVWLAVEYLVAECWFGPTISVLQSTVGPKIGGTAQGLFTVTGAIGNLAPAALGFVYSEHQQQAAGTSDGDLTNLLVLSVCGCYLLSAVCFGASALSAPPTKWKAP